MTIKVFGIFDGGGVKGAALAGCLHAIQTSSVPIEFQGYGGTSAGSLIATLASVGYSGSQIRNLLQDRIHPSSFIHDGGKKLSEIKSFKEELVSLASSGKWLSVKGFGLFKLYKKHKAVLDELLTKLGLDSGSEIERILLELIVEKIPDLRGCSDITFAQLEDCGCKPLRIVGSNITTGEAVIFARNNGNNQSVLHACRVSAGYPFLYRPIETATGRLVDGGVASNLPSFLFLDSYESSLYPTLAFDLVSESMPKSDYGLLDLGQAILNTALTASDIVLSNVSKEVKRIRIRPLPPEIDAMKFELTIKEIEELYNVGVSSTTSELHEWEYVQNYRSQAGDPESMQKQLQARYGHPRYFAAVLQALAFDFMLQTAAVEVRTQIMFPLGDEGGDRMVAYHWGYDEDDADRLLILSAEGGCSGKAYTSGKLVFADLAEAENNYSKDWKMSRAQQNAVKKDRKSMVSTPIFVKASAGQASPPKDVVLGVLSVDSSTDLLETGWVDANNPKEVTGGVTEMLNTWSEICSRLL